MRRIVMNKRMYGLGAKKSIIRELFEYAKTVRAEKGADSVFDFTIGNPSVGAPEAVSEALIHLIKTMPPEVLHGYTSAQGDANVRKMIADSLNKRFQVGISPNLIYTTKFPLSFLNTLTYLRIPPTNSRHSQSSTARNRY